MKSKIIFFMFCILATIFSNAETNSLAIAGSETKGWSTEASQKNVTHQKDNTIVVNPSKVYDDIFREITGAYSAEFPKTVFSTISLIGDAVGGWSTDIDMTTDDGDNYSLNGVSLFAGQLKFREDHDWGKNWGGNDFPEGIGNLNVYINIPVSPNGIYNVTFNRTTGAFKFELQVAFPVVSLVGDATGGWDVAHSIGMTTVDGINYSKNNVALLPGALKFKQNYLWDVNLYPSPDVTIPSHNDAWSRDNYINRIKFFKQNPLHFGDIVLLGDSLTELGGDWSARLGTPNVQNRGIRGDVTDGVLKRLNEITFYKPKSFFLLIGINDLYNLHFHNQIPSAQYVADNILKIADIIHQKSPDTKIFIQTILPNGNPLLKNDIEIINQIIVDHKDSGLYTMIDLYQEFVNEQGLMNVSLSTDGTHLNEEGYLRWVNLIKPIVAQ